MADQPAESGVEQSPLDRIGDELYAGPPEEFVATRTDRAKQARSNGDRALATAIAALRRPSRSAWMVNQLARREPDGLTALLDLGQALRQAQEELSGPDLRRLSAERHRAVDALTRQAVALAAAQGSNATEAIRREIGRTLQAALADPSTATLVRAGRLSQPADYSGFGPFTASSSSATLDTTTPEPSAPTSESTNAAAQADQREAERREAEAERREADRVSAQHEAELTAAVQHLDDASAEAVSAGQARDRLSDEVERAASALAEMQQRLGRAVDRADRCDRVLGEARHALDALRRSD